MEATPVWAQLLVSVLPWVILFVVVWYIVWRVLIRQHRPLQDRSLSYMDHMQAKTEQMVELLKQINDKLSQPRP